MFVPVSAAKGVCKLNASVNEDLVHQTPFTANAFYTKHLLCHTPFTKDISSTLFYKVLGLVKLPRALQSQACR